MWEIIMSRLSFVFCLLAAVTLVQAGLIEEADKSKVTPRVESGNYTIDGKNYYIYAGVGVNWSAASEMCAGFSMKLVSLETEEKQNTIVLYLNNIGFDNRNDYWTSGVKQADGTFLWTGINQPFDYTNWNSNENQPNIPDVTGVCVDIYEGKWWDGYCDTYERQVICQE